VPQAIALIAIPVARRLVSRRYRESVISDPLSVFVSFSSSSGESASPEMIDSKFSMYQAGTITSDFPNASKSCSASCLWVGVSSLENRWKALTCATPSEVKDEADDDFDDAGRDEDDTDNKSDDTAEGVGGHDC